METAIYKFTIYQGATWSRSMTLKTGTPLTAVNLTTYSARMTIRRNTGATALLSLTSGAGGGIVLAATGPNIVVTITAVQTAALSFTRAVYDLELVSPGGAPVDRLLKGSITLSPEVTT